MVFLITTIYLFYLLTSPYNTNQNKCIKKKTNEEKDKKPQKMAGKPQQRI